MTFVDNLSIVTDLLILVPCLVFYTGFMVWLNLRKKDVPRAQAHLREGGIMLGILGVVIGIYALQGSLYLAPRRGGPRRHQRSRVV